MASSPSAVTAAQPVATPSRWDALGSDRHALWGRCHGGGAEPYDTAVDHVHVRFRCSCPSRRRPCKHALALLLLWVRGHVPPGSPPTDVSAWTARCPTSDAAGRTTPSPGRAPADAPPSGGAGEPDRPSPVDDTAGPADRERDERVERMHAGLAELDRWLEDRIRTGLADPALASYATWDALAARLVDAGAGSLANRIRRLAGLVGASPDWHDDVLAELGMLHLLVQGGRRLGELPDALADATATAVGWQVRKADVLAGVPETDRWVVAGRSDAREDRIEVRRHWLRGTDSGRWALLLSFAAYRQSLDDTLEVGTVVHADLHRYPGGVLRALLGRRHDDVVRGVPPARSVATACDEIGSMLVAEPWLERVPATVRASPASVGGRWLLTDHTGSLPVLAPPGRERDRGVAVLLAASAGAVVDVTIEWTPRGVVPLAVHLADRTVDLGPRADPSFVGAA